MAGAEIRENVFSAIVKPNSKENKIIGFDKERNAYVISIKAPAQGNKANLELVRFLSKMTGKKARIKSGLGSRKKLIAVD